MTYIITENGITYYQYYLTGFPNFSVFGNFCIYSCIMPQESPTLASSLTTPLEDAITPQEFFTSDQKFWPYRHIPQVLTDLITPPVFENFNNSLLQINNNPKFGKIAPICFIAFIPIDT